MKSRSYGGVLLLVLTLAFSSCNSQRIPCPDVSGKKKGFLFFGKGNSNLTPQDQAKEGTDIGGRDMRFDTKTGLVKKKRVKLPTTKKKKGGLFSKK